MVKDLGEHSESEQCQNSPTCMVAQHKDVVLLNHPEFTLCLGKIPSADLGNDSFLE